MAKNKTNEKSYAVLGLGVFGSSVAKTLSENNNDVIAIDKDVVNVDRAGEYATSAVVADFTDIEQLRAVGVADVDVGVVAVGTNLEASILAIMNLKELNVPYIVAKAKNKTYMNILKKIGADYVVRPEKEMGERLAKTLMSKNLKEFLDLDATTMVAELLVPEKWANHTLKDLNLRAVYGVNVVGVKQHGQSKITLSPDADYKLKDDDLLVIIADKETFEKYELQGKL